MTRIDFAIAGFQKCGTTTLHYFLRQQPGIFMPEEKEMYYYTRFYNTPYGRRYREHFFRGAEESRLIGFSDVDLIMNAPAIQSAVNDNPNLKLIVLVRNPLERLKSAFRFEYSKGLELCSDINDALRQDQATQRFQYVERSLYADKLLVCRSIVGDNLKVIKMEDWLKNEEPIKSQLKEFLGCDFQNALLEPKNITGKPRLRRLSQLINAPPKSLANLLSLLPINVKAWLRLHVKVKLDSLNTKRGASITSINESVQLADILQIMEDEKTAMKKNFGITWE
jgi:hypothetical protein